MDNTKNFYNVLNIDPESSQKEIKQAYRSLTLKHHPDKNNNSQESLNKTQELNVAYETLSDPEKKKLYDYKLKYGALDHDIDLNDFSDINNLFSNLFKNINEQSSKHNSPFNLFSNNVPDLGGIGLMSAMGGISPMAGFPNIKIFHGKSPVDLNDFSQNPFQSFIQPDTISVQHTISFIDSYNGCSATIFFDRWLIVNSRKIKEQQKVSFDISPGISDNEIITFENIGNFIDKDNIGSLEVTIVINNDTEFKRNKNDLIYYKNISFKESLCGFSFVLNHISGKSFAINNNNDDTLSLIYNGYSKTIPNLGFKKNNEIGDLVILFDVDYPPRLSKQQIQDIRNIL
jgi:DnaJ-class molecular chaperone